MTILVVEDDPGIAEVLEFALRSEGHDVLLADRGREAIALAPDADCILLDVGLPDIDGFEVCRQIRMTSRVPLIFLTSRGEEIDRVVGLELGGDDYVSKPFSTRELTARIKAVMRRSGSTPAAAGPTADGLSLDRDSREATYRGRPLQLSRLEFDLLGVLAESPGRVFTREQLLDKAWPDGGCVTDRTVDAHIKSIRRKLADPEVIETLRGVGYRLRAGG